MSRLTKACLWGGAVLLFLMVLAAGTIGYYLHRAEPTLRASLIETLQKRFNARVELDGFHVSILDGFWVEASGLRIWLPEEEQAALKAQDAEAAQQYAIEAEAAAQKAAKQKKDAPQRPARANFGPQDWETQPWIVADKLRFHVSWRILPGRPILVSVIYVEGVRTLLPPKGERPNLSLSQHSGSESGSESAGAAQPDAATAATPGGPQSPSSQSSQSSLFKIPHIEVRQVECKSVELVLEKGAQDRAVGKIPLDFHLASLSITPDGKGGPMAFAVEMTNPKPVGLIHSTGHAGPISAARTGGDPAQNDPGHFDPGALPVDGDYHFDHADLSTIKGIAGILSSTGHYSGTLRRIEVNGQTQTPDFRLERVSAGAGLPLSTRFHAIVDGTNGNTWLDPVDATLDRTHFIARGQVVRAADGHGHDIALLVNLDHGRIEDILRISANADKPFMTGALTLNTKFHLPPGPEKVFEKLQLDGQFHLTEARFSNEKVQGGIEQLSLRGQGKPHDVHNVDPTTVLSEMRGHFTLGGGELRLPDLDYEVPGAQILVGGAYGLKDGTLDFAGNARMDATVSKMVGGWKGFLLKPADRFLKKNGAGTDVPIHLKGTRKDPIFGVDLDRIGKPDGTTGKK